MDERKNNRRGNYSMMMAFSVVGIVGFGALGVDISYIAMANTQAAAVSDAASHAALLTFRQASGTEGVRQTKGADAADWVVKNNDVGFNAPGQLESIEFGIFNSASGNFSSGSSPANAARARVTRTGGNGIELMLAPIIGINNADVDQSGTTVANPREIVVAIDRSGSMNDGTPITGKAGTDLALTEFSKYMVNNQVPLDRIGATRFNYQGDWWDTLKYVQGNGGTILPKWSSWETQTCQYTTNQAAGIIPAHNALKNSGNDLAFKAIIVISDGNPCCGDNTASRTQAFKDATAAAWGDGIHVWTVAFGSNINDGLMETATKGLGTYEKSPDATGLAAVMLKIAESIPVALVQ